MGAARSNRHILLALVAVLVAVLAARVAPLPAETPRPQHPRLNPVMVQPPPQRLVLLPQQQQQQHPVPGGGDAAHGVAREAAGWLTSALGAVRAAAATEHGRGAAIAYCEGTVAAAVPLNCFLSDDLRHRFDYSPAASQLLLDTLRVAAILERFLVLGYHSVINGMERRDGLLVTGGSVQEWCFQLRARPPVAVQVQLCF